MLLPHSFLVLLLPLPRVERKSLLLQHCLLQKDRLIARSALERLRELSGSLTTSLALLQGRQLVADLLTPSAGSVLTFFPNLQKLQKGGAEEVQLLAVVNEPPGRIHCYSGDIKHMLALSVKTTVDEYLLQKLHGLSCLPHLLWVGREGKVLAAIEGYYITAGNIRQAAGHAKKHNQQTGRRVPPRPVTKTEDGLK